MIYLQIRQTRPSIAGALHSGWCVPKILLPLPRLEVARASQGVMLGLFSIFVHNRLLAECRGREQGLEHSHTSIAARAWLALAQSPAKPSRAETVHQEMRG